MFFFQTSNGMGEDAANAELEKVRLRQQEQEQQEHDLEGQQEQQEQQEQQDQQDQQEQEQQEQEQQEHEHELEDKRENLRELVAGAPAQPQLGQLSMDCACFLTRNIYIEKVGAVKIDTHFVFENEEKFRADYADFLAPLSFLKRDGSIATDLIAAILEEKRRREQLDCDLKGKRAQITASGYSPIHPEVYHLLHSQLDPGFLRILRAIREGKGAFTKADLLALPEFERVDEDIFAFSLFTPAFCRALMEEAMQFSDPDRGCGKIAGRPNSMNHHGVLLDEMGMTQGFTDELVRLVMHPLTSLLYPKHGGCTLDNHR